VKPVPCRRKHTALTYYVGTLDTVVDGHLLAVDAEQVRAQVAQECPRRLPRSLNTDPGPLRLTVLRPVWFSPTLAQSDQGQDWFRCDVIALAGPERLAPLSRDLVGALGTPSGRAAYAVCGTAEPGAPGFQRVICSHRHSWRAITVYEIPGDRYPGQPQARRSGETRCQGAAEAVAKDPLSYQWGYDWPTADQWRSGQHFGLCWAPD
jgi:hypothetical protein